MAEPRAIVVKRWVCGGVACRRSYSSRAAIEGHMETCWKVPENRACLTCVRFQLETCCSTAGPDCGCRGERKWSCAIAIPIEPGKPVVGCDQWRAA